MFILVLVYFIIRWKYLWCEPELLTSCFSTENIIMLQFTQLLLKK